MATRAAVRAPTAPTIRRHRPVAPRTLPPPAETAALPKASAFSTSCCNSSSTSHVCLWGRVCPWGADPIRWHTHRLAPHGVDSMTVASILSIRDFLSGPSRIARWAGTSPEPPDAERIAVSTAAEPHATSRRRRSTPSRHFGLLADSESWYRALWQVDRLYGYVASVLGLTRISACGIQDAVTAGAENVPPSNVGRHGLGGDAPWIRRTSGSARGPTSARATSVDMTCRRPEAVPAHGVVEGTGCPGGIMGHPVPSSAAPPMWRPLGSRFSDGTPPHRHVRRAFGGELVAVPVGEPRFEFHAREPGHQVEFGRPHVAKIVR